MLVPLFSETPRKKPERTPSHTRRPDHLLHQMSAPGRASKHSEAVALPQGRRWHVYICNQGCGTGIWPGYEFLPVVYRMLVL